MSVHEAKAHYSAVLKEVEAGEVVIVTRHGKPIVEMRSIHGLATPQLGAFAEPSGSSLDVSWTDEELNELFGDALGPAQP